MVIGYAIKHVGSNTSFTKEPLAEKASIIQSEKEVYTQTYTYKF